jgi:hypothetical protein
LVDNPRIFASSEFRRTGLYKWLLQKETPIITIPEMHSVTKNYWEELEDKQGQHLSISKVIATKDCLDMAYYELSGIKDLMFRQFEDSAKYLVPAKRFHRQFPPLDRQDLAGVVPRRLRLGKRPPPGPSWPQPPALCQLIQKRVGLFQAEPIRLQRSEFMQSSIDALKALLQYSAEQIPGPCRLTRAGLGQHPKTSLQP